MASKLSHFASAVALKLGSDGCYALGDGFEGYVGPVSVAAVDGIYVSHMRGGYEDNSAAGLAEVVDICRAAGVRGHVSHFHARSELVCTLMDAAVGRADLTFDSYPYSRGSSVLSMLLLPPDLLQSGVEACATQMPTAASIPFGTTPKQM